MFFKEKKKQAASLVVLVDTSTSMIIGDEVRGQTRWDVAQQVGQAGEGVRQDAGPELDVKFYGFDSKLSEPKAGELVEEAEAEGPRDRARARRCWRPRNGPKAPRAGWPGS